MVCFNTKSNEDLQQVLVIFLADNAHKSLSGRQSDSSMKVILAKPKWASIRQIELLNTPAALQGLRTLQSIEKVSKQFLKSAASTLDRLLVWQDDGSGRQEWTITQVTGGYTISISTGRAGCAPFLSSGTCAAGNGVGFAATNDGSGLAIWGLTPVNSVPPASAQLFQNGIYTIGSTGRAACGNNLNAATCAAGNGVLMDAPAGAESSTPADSPLLFL